VDSRAARCDASAILALTSEAAMTGSVARHAPKRTSDGRDGRSIIEAAAMEVADACTH
jgi:hypothetical protein